MAASLAKIGIKVNIKLASIDAMFTKFCVVQQYLPELCTLGWLPDFKDPVTMLDPLFNGKAINPNYTNNDVALRRPAGQRGDREGEESQEHADARYAAWGKIDQLITLQAAVIMTQWSNTPPTSSPTASSPRSRSGTRGCSISSATSIK